MANNAGALSQSAQRLLGVLQERSIVETFSSTDAAELIAGGYVERFRDGLIVTDAGLAYKPRGLTNTAASPHGVVSNDGNETR